MFDWVIVRTSLVHKEMLLFIKQLNNMLVLLFDFKTVRQLGCVSVRLRGLCFIIWGYSPKFRLLHVSLVVDATVLASV